MTNIIYTYTKIRKNFGRQPQFCQLREHIIDSIFPDKKEQKMYILRNPVSAECQVSATQSEHYLNTTRVMVENEGINHAEGGWAKDINYIDEEQTSRYRRRIERDEAYIDAVLASYNKLHKCISQNNAIELYQMFYKGMQPLPPVEKTMIRLNNLYRDIFERPVGSLCWTIEEDPKLVVAYCDTRFPVSSPLNHNKKCAVWNLENPNEPTFEVDPPSACWQAVCSPAHPSLILGGLHDGRVCIFDIRSKTEPESISPEHLAHRDPVTSLVYMQSRLNLEFFSGSTDGACKWWDVRNLSNFTDFFTMSVKAESGQTPSLANAEPVSVLQYEKSFPTKFLAGTDTGLVVGINRKGKSLKEMVYAVFEAHLGPVKSVQRSPVASKMFLTCGDWTTHIWSEDVTISPIITGKGSRHKINDATWAPQRFSCYMTVSSDGVFRYWDLLRRYREPINSLQLSKNPLLRVKPQEEGRFIAVGDAKGIVYIISLSDNLAQSAEIDKQLMLQAYERENRREHILESRVKEIRVKQLATEEKAAGPDEEMVDEEALLRETEEEFRRMVTDEIRRSGYTAQTGQSRSVGRSPMRKR